MSIEGKKELQRVLIENLYGRIEQGDREEFAVWTVTDRQHVVSHLERSSVDQGRDRFRSGLV